MHRHLLALLGVVLLVSCSDPDAGDTCLVNDDCLATARCINGMCVPRDLRDGSTPSDAPTTDAPLADAPLPDAPAFDAETCGMPCDTGNPCAAGAFDCATGAPICVGAGPAASTVVCRESLGACDPAETCNGTSTECPPDARAPAGENCRPADGSCDLDETCDGTSPLCPIDVFQPAATPCPVGNLCDGSGNCSACVTGAPCQPSDPCRTGTLNCATRTPMCVVAGNAADGTTCGPTSPGVFSACSFSGECGETGTQSRNVTYNECNAGTCASVVRPDVRECSRVTEGNACAARRTDTCGRCDTGLCRDFLSCAPGLICCPGTFNCRADCPRE